MSNTNPPCEWEHGLAEAAIEISTPAGNPTVTGLTHKSCPGLAVTMHPFGVFKVTHIPTGLKLGRAYERASSALLAMSQFALVANQEGKSWASLDQAAAIHLIESAGSQKVPFEGFTVSNRQGTRKMTVQEWFQAVRFPTFDEFPWEERDPLDDAILNFEKIEAAT